MAKQGQEPGMAQLSDNPKPTFLQSKFQIGSRKGPINYGHTETVFHPDDISAEKKANRDDIMQYKKKSVLGDSKPQWNSSVYVQKKICEDKRIRANFEHDRAHMHQYNYRAEVLPEKIVAPPPKTNRYQVHAVGGSEIERRANARANNKIFQGIAKRTEEMKVNPKLDDKPEWNACTVLTKNEKKALFNAKEAQCQENSKRKKEKLKNYRNPEQLVKEHHRQDRIVKSAGQQAILMTPSGVPVPLRPSMLESSRISNQDSTMSNASMMTYNRLAKNPTQKERKFAHSGAWEFNQIEQRWMWSDTGSYEKDSPGDIVTIVNPNAYNFASPSHN